MTEQIKKITEEALEVTTTSTYKIEKAHLLMEKARYEEQITAINEKLSLFNKDE